ncbi:MAG: hypothetical protein LAO19_15465 [Acidobacteriia bacterium]|nr:hypothetical protein [Terriglobia bacterium]
MSIEYRLDQTHKEIQAVASGTVTIEDVRAHLLKEQASDLLGCREIIDAREAMVQLSPMDMREIVGLLGMLSRGNKLGATAVVVPNDVGYGMIRMLQMLVEDTCIVEPFRDLTAAQNWIRALPASRS